VRLQPIPCLPLDRAARSSSQWTLYVKVKLSSARLLFMLPARLSFKPSSKTSQSAFIQQTQATF
jgi:hypothetical protein